MGDVLNENRTMSSISSGSSTITSEAQPSTSNATVTLNLTKRRNSKKVVFTDDTVDNEDLNRKKSKCCCIWEKPKTLEESESESEDECDNCYGHKPKKGHPQDGSHDGHDHPEDHHEDAQ